MAIIGNREVKYERMVTPIIKTSNVWLHRVRCKCGLLPTRSPFCHGRVASRYQMHNSSINIDSHETQYIHWTMYSNQLLVMYATYTQVVCKWYFQDNGMRQMKAKNRGPTYRWDGQYRKGQYRGDRRHSIEAEQNKTIIAESNCESWQWIVHRPTHQLFVTWVHAINGWTRPLHSKRLKHHCLFGEGYTVDSRLSARMMGMTATVN